MINFVIGICYTPLRCLKQWWIDGTCRMHTKISPSYTIKVEWLQAMGPLVGPINKGVIWVTTAAFNLHGHQRHTLTTAHCALQPTAIAVAQTYTIMPLAQQTSRADHTIRGHLLTWKQRMRVATSRFLTSSTPHPDTTLSLTETYFRWRHPFCPLPPPPLHSPTPYLLLHMNVVIPTKIKLPLA